MVGAVAQADAFGVLAADVDADAVEGVYLK
jgi:hypothetical protein